VARKRTLGGPTAAERSWWLKEEGEVLSRMRLL